MSIVIFDLGSNTFRITRKLIKKFGKKNVSKVHTFEAQQGLGNLKKLRKEFPGIEFCHNNVAVWTSDCELDFFECTEWGPNHKGGSTVLQNKQTGGMDYDNPIKVPAIDFVEYFCKNSGETNFIKMDVEGAEYEILPKLLNSSCASSIDELACEFHAHMFSDEKMLDTEQNILDLIKANDIKLTRWR